MSWNIIVRYSDCPYRVKRKEYSSICYHVDNKTWHPRYCIIEHCPLKVSDK